MVVYPTCRAPTVRFIFLELLVSILLTLPVCYYFSMGVYKAVVLVVGWEQVKGETYCPQDINRGTLSSGWFAGWEVGSRLIILILIPNPFISKVAFVPFVSRVPALVPNLGFVVLTDLCWV